MEGVRLRLQLRARPQHQQRQEARRRRRRHHLRCSMCAPPRRAPRRTPCAARHAPWRAARGAWRAARGATPKLIRNTKHEHDAIRCNIISPIEQARVLKVAPQVRQPVLKTMLLTASTAWAGATSGLCSSTFTRPAHRRAACRSARICSPGRRGGGRSTRSTHVHS